MKQHLDGHVALITGSTSGIGLGIAQELVANGARVILNGIEASGTGRCDCRILGRAAVYLHADLSRTDAVVALMAKARQLSGGWIFWSMARASSTSPRWLNFRPRNTI